MVRRGLSLSQQAAWAERNDERIAQHRAEAELWAEIDRSEETEAGRRGSARAILSRLLSRVRSTLGR